VSLQIQNYDREVRAENSAQMGTCKNLSFLLLYFAAYVGSIACWIPCLSLWETNKLISSKNVAVPSYIILGMTIPVFIHLVCDIFARTYTAAFTRCYRLFSILLPCLIISFYAVPNKYVSAIFAVVHSQAILVVSGFIIRSHTCGGEVWTISSALLLLCSWVLFKSAELYSLHDISTDATKALNTTSWISVSVCILLLLYKSIVWFSRAVPLYLKVKAVDINQFSCSKNVIILNAVIFFDVLLHNCVSLERYIIATLLLYNMGTLLVIVLHDYVVAREAAKVKVSIHKVELY